MIRHSNNDTALAVFRAALITPRTIKPIKQQRENQNTKHIKSTFSLLESGDGSQRYTDNIGFAIANCGITINHLWYIVMIHQPTLKLLHTQELQLQAVQNSVEIE